MQHDATNEAVVAEIHTNDTFQSGLKNILVFAENHAKSIFIIAIAGLLGGLGYFGYKMVLDRIERKAQEAYYSVQVKLDPIQSEFERAKYQSLVKTESTKKEDKAKEPSGNLQNDFGGLMTELEQVARQYPATSAGAQAAIGAAKTYLEYQKPDQAIEILQVVAAQAPKNRILSGLVDTLLGNAMANKGDCESAVSVWQRVLDQKSYKFLHSEVSLRSGLCYESLNQSDKAREMFQLAAADDSGSIGNMASGGKSSPSQTKAKALLRALDLNSTANNK